MRPILAVKYRNTSTLIGNASPLKVLSSSIYHALPRFTQDSATKELMPSIAGGPHQPSLLEIWPSPICSGGSMPLWNRWLNIGLFWIPWDIEDILGYWEPFCRAHRALGISQNPWPWGIYSPHPPPPPQPVTCPLPPFPLLERISNTSDELWKITVSKPCPRSNKAEVQEFCGYCAAPHPLPKFNCETTSLVSAPQQNCACKIQWGLNFLIIVLSLSWASHPNLPWSCFPDFVLVLFQQPM